MIYLHGNIDKPETWKPLDANPNPFESFPFKIFKSKKEARAWVLKELRRRVKEINATISEWMHEKDKL